MQQATQRFTPLDEWLENEALAILAPSFASYSFRDLIIAAQTQRLVKSFEHAAKNSYFYKKKFADLNMEKLLSDLKFAKIDKSQGFAKTNDCQSEDLKNYELAYKKVLNFLAKIPFTYPQELNADSMPFLCIAQDEVEGISTVESSGTSGQSKRIFASQHDMESSINFFQHGMKCVLQNDPEPKVALLMSGTGVGSVAYLLSEALKKLKVPCHVLGFPKNYPDCLKELKRIKPSCIIGIPWQIFVLSRMDEATFLKDCLQTVLLSGDVAVPALRKSIEKNFNCDLYLHYGLTEFGLGGFVECHKHFGVHGRELDLFVEIIDNQGENIASQSECPKDTAKSFLASPFGEIVISSLNREAMPLLRYRTGDLGRIIYEECPCGSKLFRLEVLGRKRNFLSLPKDFYKQKAISIHSFEEILYPYEEILDFKLTAFWPETEKNAGENNERNTEKATKTEALSDGTRSLLLDVYSKEKSKNNNFEKKLKTEILYIWEALKNENIKLKYKFHDPQSKAWQDHFSTQAALKKALFYSDKDFKKA